MQTASPCPDPSLLCLSGGRGREDRTPFSAGSQLGRMSPMWLEKRNGQPADLLVEPGDEGFTGFVAHPVVLSEDAGPLQTEPFSPDLAGMGLPSPLSWPWTMGCAFYDLVTPPIPPLPLL